MTTRSACPIEACPEWVRLNAEVVRLGNLTEISEPDWDERWADFCEANRLILKHLYSPHKEGA